MLNRRKILTAITGSILGGRQAADSIISTAGRGLAAGLSLSGGGQETGGQDYPSVKPDYPGENLGSLEKLEAARKYRGNRLAQLQNMLTTGELDSWMIREQENYRNLKEKKRSFEVDQFKSLSVVGKLMILDKRDKEESKKAWLEQAAKELKELLDFKEPSVADLLFGDNAKSTQVDKSNNSW